MRLLLLCIWVPDFFKYTIQWHIQEVRYEMPNSAGPRSQWHRCSQLGSSLRKSASRAYLIYFCYCAKYLSFIDPSAVGTVVRSLLVTIFCSVHYGIYGKLLLESLCNPPPPENPLDFRAIHGMPMGLWSVFFGQSVERLFFCFFLFFKSCQLANQNF